jgi:hypothetical protein
MLGLGIEKRSNIRPRLLFKTVDYLKHSVIADEKKIRLIT